MSFLLDTNIISELRKPARRADAALRAWAQRQATSELSISVITVMEIEIGVASVERRDPALTHNLIVVTRKVLDFRSLGVEVLNPGKDQGTNG